MMETERVQATPPGFIPGPSLASQEGLLPPQGVPQSTAQGVAQGEPRPSDPAASEREQGSAATMPSLCRPCQSGE